MANNYLEFRETVKKYEFDKMFEDDNTMQEYSDILLHDVYTAIKAIDEIDPSSPTEVIMYNVTFQQIYIITKMLYEIHRTIPSDVMKAIAYEIKFRIENNVDDSDNYMILFAAIINNILA